MLKHVREAAANQICQDILQVTIGVHEKHRIATDARKAEVIKNYLEQQLTRDETPLGPFVEPTRPIECLFTDVEMSAAARSLKDRRATGPAGIPNELFNL